MLVLSTELEGGIKIGENITIKVLDVRTRQVRLGINAPRSVMIERESFEELVSTRRDREQKARENAGITSLNAMIVSGDAPCRVEWSRAVMDAGLKEEHVLMLDSMAHTHTAVRTPGMTEALGLLIVDLDGDANGDSSREAEVILRLRAAIGRQSVSILALIDDPDETRREALLRAGATHVMPRRAEPAFRRKAIRSATWLAAASLCETGRRAS